MADGQDNKLALGAMLKASAAQQMLQVGERGRISCLIGLVSLDAAGTLHGVAGQRVGAHRCFFPRAGMKRVLRTEGIGAREPPWRQPRGKH